ncbi:YbaK/EbsC family protein [Aliiroseovarius sp. KMU-50]|uniref:YbaK/EbsC family protein n=1 Tax=Aliiroseovarius salicola TaxID=3009082 RepID=A0ABT4VZW7_9RHOB|nr:YbaK/EbsC family protein [Aliiroseovarius sp. KMU-50]MDA5093808.1 YbaK/EbsC family protein [Aliiroseovarius sp. KMU-50]
MTISARLEHHLSDLGLHYSMIPHPYAATAAEVAEAAHVPGDHLAKSVLIHMEEGPMLAVVPSNQQVDLTALQSLMQKRLGLAPETEMKEVFNDCDLGAAPPVGEAYDVPTIVDDSLSGLDKIWFEGGDHTTLIEMRGRDFDKMMKDAEHGSFCCLH